MICVDLERERQTDRDKQRERQTERETETERKREGERERGARWKKRFPCLRETRKKQKILMLICHKIHGDMGHKCRAIIT